MGKVAKNRNNPVLTPELTPAGQPAPGGVTEQPMVAPAPEKGARLTRGGTSSGRLGQIVTAANRWRENYNPLRGLTIRRAVDLLELGQRGDMAYLQWTYRFIERRHPTLSALITRCEAPLAKYDWHVKVKAQLPAGATAEMAAAQKETLEAAYDGIDNLREALLHLHLADFRGYAHLQKHRAADGTVYHLEPLRQWCICKDGLEGNWFWNPDSRSTSAPLQFLGKGFCIGGEELPLDDFVIRECPRPIDEIGLINLIRQNLCEKDADGFLEIYGIPGGVVIMPPNMPQGKETEYETAAKMVAEGGSGALPSGADYKPNDGPRGVDPFTPRLAHLDEQIVLVGTGGRLTMLSESGSGTLAGGAHEDSFYEIADGRAQQISETLQRAMDAEVLAREHAGEPACVYFWFGDEEDEGDLSGLCKNVLTLAQAGKAADVEWLIEKTGYQLTDKPADGAAIGAEAAGDRPDADGSRGDQDAEPEESETDDDPIKNREQAGKAAGFGAAVGEDIGYVLERLQKILSIQDDAIFATRLKQFLADFPQLEKDVLADPRSARVLRSVIEQGFLDGLRNLTKNRGAGQKILNGDVPGHEFHGNQYGEGIAGGGKSERARASFKPATLAKQRAGVEMEGRVAKLIGGENLRDNEPADIIKGKNAVEVKTLVDQKNDKITMHPDALERKLRFGRREKMKWHTVAIDARTKPPGYYYRKGVGSFRLGTMKKVSEQELAGLIK